LAGVGVLSAVVESGSFTRAAALLALSASGVSRAVSRLEERLGVRLLDRTTRALRLTDEGERFYTLAAPHLDAIADAAIMSQVVGRPVRVQLSRDQEHQWEPKGAAQLMNVDGGLDHAGGVAAYHLFPDFVGGKNEAMRKDGLENGRKVIEFAMKTKGSSPFIAGELSLADLYLAPIVFYVSLTPDKEALFEIDGFPDWWTKMQALQSYKDTQPNLG